MPSQQLFCWCSFLKKQQARSPTVWMVPLQQSQEQSFQYVSCKRKLPKSLQSLVRLPAARPGVLSKCSEVVAIRPWLPCTGGAFYSQRYRCYAANVLSWPCSPWYKSVILLSLVSTRFTQPRRPLACKSHRVLHLVIQPIQVYLRVVANITHTLPY